MKFRTFLENTSLQQQLMSARSRIAFEAQKIYNSWNQIDGIDEELGSGGICDEIANKIADIVSSYAEITYGGQDGDDHAWVVAYNDREAYGVDIPHQIYERGGGYSWTKIPNITFTADNVEIWQIERNWIET